MRKDIQILGVKLWGMASHDNPTLQRYAVYYKREGAMWRGLVDAEDELSAWRKFYETVDGPERMIYRMSPRDSVGAI